MYICGMNVVNRDTTPFFSYSSSLFQFLQKRMSTFQIGVPASSSSAAIIPISGSNCHTLKDLYGAIAEALAYPDDFGFKVDELDDLLSDLSWIEDTHLTLFFTETEEWLIKERNKERIFTMLDLLQGVVEDWHWVDSEEEDKKTVAIYFEPSERISKLMEEAGIE